MNQLDLVILGSTTGAFAFPDKPLFDAQAKRVRDYLLTVEPFKSRASQLNIQSLLTSVDLKLTRSTVTTRLITVAQSYAKSACEQAGLSVEKGIVLANTTGYGGSGGGQFCVAYCGVDGPKVAVHEFGHTLASLHDEYVSYSGGSVQNRQDKNAWLGAPTAQFPYAGCKYGAWSRCASNCGMKSLGVPFCRECLKLLNEKLDALAEPCILPEPAPSPTPAPLPTADGPLVKFTNPTTDRTTTERFQVSALATQTDAPIAKIALHLGDDLKASATSKNVQGKWAIGWWWTVGNYASGTYTLTASATDVNGKVGTATVTVTRP